MAVKKRVFQVAREFNISNEALIEFLRKLDFDIRNHMSLLSDDAYQQVIQKYGVQEEQVDADYEFRKRLKDRKTIEETKKNQAREELERRLEAAQSLAKERPTIKRKKDTEKEALEPKKKPTEKPVEEKRAKAAPPEKTTEPIPKKKKKKLKVIEIPPEESEKKTKEPAKPPKKEEPVAEEKPTVEARPEKPVAEEKKKEEEKPDTEKKAKKRRRRKKKKEGVEEEQQTKPKKEKRKKKPKKRRPVFDEQEIEDTIRQTLATFDETGKPKKKKKRTAIELEEPEEETPVIKVSEYMSLSELANLMDVDSAELIKKCMELGMMVTINQRLDMDTITLLASEYGFEVEALKEFGEDVLDEIQEEDDVGTLTPRAPVVTIMGHVDHGKTSLLDHIRKSNIISGEAGGITQHIGAYEVSVDGKNITFLDTPGHEAFTAMRARGAQVTDIVVLIVAADDSVMPQTIEAISHAKAAGVTMVVAINKVDKPGANPDMIRKQLADHGVLIEEWGGQVQAVEVSAKTGQNIEKLLEAILLEAELLDLKANHERKAKGVIIESRLDKGKGAVATVLVQSGTLSIGDPYIAGSYSGKVRNMLDERGKRVKSVGPSQPVQVLGFDGLPQAGDSLIVLDTERDTKEISSKRQQLQREHEHWKTRPRTLDEISKQIQQGQIQQLAVVVKADVDGSIQAITDSLMKLSTDEVAVNVIHKGVGAISESDVLLASASGAIIIGFNVRPTNKSRELAAKENVDIRQYDVIYDILNDIKAALEGFLAPDISEELTGTIEVRQIFKIPKTGVVAGAYVSSGRVSRNDKIKLYRDDRLVHDGTISSLKRFKEDVKQVASGYECGIGLERFDDIKVNDVMESYKVVETKRSLEQNAT